ncbi:hypothetical protein PsAD2_01915 [Pseudovibrio axinellae]|uniref:Uncharacterized protein n=1 Tax=Pseudovibrio axinellae TaxID=989403 RepID=A0A165Z9V9_9HYPH|nr:hypothetical protein [Pseudovibrio axinellae]KZL19636.1 hypothetical protein PsAD2_01915 [Pseudovibrio axinellae]SEQ35067.1 hypothetical protein SAMN05421798_102476 [Pseudovibrio axinellae]
MLQLAKVSAFTGLSFMLLTTAVIAEPNASFGDSFSSDEPVSLLSGEDTLPQNKMTTSGNYSVSTPILAKGWETNKDGTAGDSLQQILPVGTQLSVLDWANDDTKGELVRLGVDEPEEAGEAASDIFVSKADFATYGLSEATKLSRDEANNIAGSEEDSYIGYASAVVAARSGGRRSVRKRRGMTYCYRYVKKHLISEGLVDTYIPGGSAYMAIQSLPKYGFKRLRVSSPDRAPVGSICVYDRDKRNRHGHIEVKKSDTCYWFGYGCNKNSMYGRRDFYDCFAKGDVKRSFWASLSSKDKKPKDKRGTSTLIRKNDPSERK